MNIIDILRKNLATKCYMMKMNCLTCLMYTIAGSEEALRIYAVCLSSISSFYCTSEGDFLHYLTFNFILNIEFSNVGLGGCVGYGLGTRS